MSASFAPCGEELGKDFIVMTDANQGYSMDVALQGRRPGSPTAGAFWLEEPLFVEDVEGHAALRERGKVPIAVGENLHTCGAFRDFVVRGAVDFIQPDVARAGGIREIRKITALAAKHKVPVSFHTWGDGVALAASVHLAAALQRLHRHGARLHLQSTARRTIARAIQSSKRFLIPPERPGLGH